MPPAAHDTESGPQRPGLSAVYREDAGAEAGGLVRKISKPLSTAAFPAAGGREQGPPHLDAKHPTTTFSKRAL